MTKLSTQFHALPEELVPLVGKWLNEPRLQAYASEGKAKSVHLVAASELEETLGSPTVSELFFVRGEAELPAAGSNDFLRKNPEALVLDLGRLTEKGLDESGLSARMEDPVTTKLWRKLDRQLKELITAGVVVQSLVKPDTFGFNRNHHYSAEAKKLAERGVALLGIGSAYVFRPDLPASTVPAKKS